MLRPLPLLLLGLLSAGAHALTFGGLTVTPRGEQRLNLDTGATDLPQGGTATDARRGLTLNAARLNLLPGQTLKATGATVTTKQGGTLKAPQLTYDLNAGTVTASGGVTYTDARLQGLSAPTLTLHLKTGFVVASGGVQAKTPALSGAALVFDPATVQAVLTGPYQVNQGTLKAQAPAGGRLLMVFSANRVVRATQTPDPDTLARFGPYLK
ncbi:hypothetical protein [Deinococcus arcticus]|uniref:Organic solvent tolerance-like N-terminal domain-containing protein n=1 Tax=Deinococcus arcticus TaxID=2136176 RepID=A0A2T3WCA3_9DEIO|nr:hypothetical protein [Deinococcus arcticus]PTA69531.1 hypothetical protein C8263_00390 [Deinococcus arcticus]